MADTFPRKRIRKVLIANRGEIAVRILRGLHEMGIRGAVDLLRARPPGAPRAARPTRRIRSARPPRARATCAGEAIVELAVKIGADAIHPGYGFLSERAGFARLCRDAGITFIGPSPEAIDAMGSKVESRAADDRGRACPSCPAARTRSPTSKAPPPPPRRSATR